MTTKTLQLTKTTPSGKTAEILYDNTAPMSRRFEVLVDGVSGGVNAGPKTVKIGASAKTAKSVTVIAWGDKFIELAPAEVKALGGIDAPKIDAPKAAKSGPASRCRVCGRAVNYSEQFAKSGYCGCEGA